MKNAIAHFLITCLLAISLHGFGTDEHVYKTDAGELIQVSSKTDLGDTKRNIPNLGAACDICQVVHQYVTREAGDAYTPTFAQTHYAVNAHDPLSGVPDDILHPPTI